MEDIKILLIEDLVADSVLFKYYCGDYGSVVDVVGDTRDAAGTIQDYDVVFTDLDLPGSSPMDTLAWVEEQIENHGTLFVVITGSQNPAVARALASLRIPFLHKSAISPESMEFAIEWAIGSLDYTDELSRHVGELCRILDPEYDCDR